jgi:hypothetical protein
MPKLLLSLLETRPLPTPAIKLYCISQPEGKKTKRDKSVGVRYFSGAASVIYFGRWHISLDYFIRDNFVVGNQSESAYIVM